MRSPRPCHHFVGVDIAAKSATVVVQSATDATPSPPVVIEQTPDGFSALQGMLLQAHADPGDTVVVMEATGSY